MKEEFEEELREISPFLADLKKQDPFKTPKFYFDTLADSVLEKASPKTTTITTPQYNEQKSPLSRANAWFSTLLQPRWAMAIASVAMLAVGSWFYFKKDNTTPTQELTEITTDEIQEYIKSNIDEFEDDLLVENAQSTPDTEGGSLLKDINNEELEQYLKENLEDGDLENIH